MSDTFHYKYGKVNGDNVAFCELEASYYPKRNTPSKNKLNPLKNGASFGEGFCSKCKEKLKDLKLM